MNSLLTVAEPDGFPVGSYCVIYRHAHNPEMIGDLVCIKEEARQSFGDVQAEDGTFHEGYYGQMCYPSFNTEMEAFLALSWMRPATEAEIQEAGL